MTPPRNRNIGAGSIRRLVIQSKVSKRLLARFTAILVVGGATAFADLNAGLVAYYPFDGNANDASGNGNHGSLYNGVHLTTDRFSRPNSAFEFDGVDDYIRIPDSVTLRSPTNAITLAVWATIYRYAGSWAVFLAKSDSSVGGRQYGLNVAGNTLVFENLGYSTAATLPPFSTNQWHHYAITYDRAFVRFYFDGSCFASNALTVVLQQNSLPLMIGCDPPGANEFFTGKMDEIRVYNRPLSATEVAQLYYLGQTENSFVSSVGASQRPGTSSVDISYTLSLSNASTANVSLSISTNNGVTFSIIPAVGSLSGDLTSVPPGSRRITWNASQTLSSGAFGTAFKARVVAVAGGGPGSGDSPRFTLDLQGLAGGLAVKGRVLDAQTRAPVSGATVTLAGQSTSTSASGDFSFPNVSLSSGNTLTVSQTGFVTYSDTINASPGSTLHTAPDIFLQATPGAGTPVVTGIKAKYDGLLLGGLHFQNEYTAIVNWNGAAPGAVKFYTNGQLVVSIPGSSNPLACSLDVATSFRPSFQSGANQITVVAQSAGSVQSSPVSRDVNVIALPAALQEFLGDYVLDDDGSELGISLGLHLPEPGWDAVVNLPVVGKFGLEWAFIGRVDYTLPSGEWELVIGAGVEGKQGKRGRRPDIPGLTQHPRMKLYIGNKEVEGELLVGGKGTALLGRGFTLDDELSGHLRIDTKLELGRFGLPDLLGPGLSTTLGQIPGVDKVLNTVTIIIYARPGFEGQAIVLVKPRFSFKEGEFTGKLGLEAAYEPDLGVAEARFYVGGEPSVTFHYDQTSGVRFKELRFRAYAGAEAHVWVFDVGPVEYVFVNEVIASGSGPSAALALGAPKVSRVVNREAGVRPMRRDYLKAGGERFVANQVQVGGVLRDGTPGSKQAAFLAMKSDAVAVDGPKGALGPRKYELESNGPKQADWAVAENVFPAGRPALAARNVELMLLYVTDRGLTNDLQFTEIAWTRFDGTNWSTPLTIRTNTQAEFAPQVGYDGNGDALAVWERVADLDFNSTNLMDMAAQMEVVWSRWSRTNDAWSEPIAFTANSYLDHAPLLCGPMTNGDLMTVWTKNEVNLLMGTNDVGADTVLWSKWSPASQSWSTTEVLASDLSYRLSQSLAGISNRAVYAWTRDLDGVLTNDADQEVYYCIWTNGAWGAVKQLTTNNVPDKTVRAAVSPAGDVYLVWQQGTNLVMNRNFSTNTSIVRPSSQTAGFSDFVLSFGPAGNLVLVWQEMSQDGSDPYYSAYDPVSGTWSKDARLFADASLERSFATAWDSATNLNIAFNRVAIILTNKTVTLEGGGTVTITNVPQPGRVDLAVVARKLIKDLALQAGDFSIQGEDYLPGDALTLSATVRNAGDLAVTNILVEFFDGNPTNGGVFLTNAFISGWLEGATSAVAVANWVVPAPATNRTIYAIVNRTNAANEFNTNNNAQAVSIGGTDLVVSLVSAVAETNGSVRVIAQVHNIGAPRATNSVLAIRREGETNAPLATVEVLALEPGRLAQVALDLPPGTQPAGEAVYRLFADETRVVADVDTNNNKTAFAVNLWIDTDGDGVPDNWMMQYFGHADGQAGDLSRPQDDADGDGMSNLAEYLAGTSPKDASSYLRITSVAVGGRNGVQVVWGSATNKLYSVERGAALGAGGTFTNIAEHILSTPPENGYLDVTATNSSAFFYRIRVE
jgi:hypothetical protein